jgi:hypothetical protein
VAALRAPGFDPAREVLLLGGRPLPPAGAPPLGSATITRDDSDLLEITATADADGYLLLADSYYPGWWAEVDGQPAEVLRANYAFRAVPLSPGAHTVRLVFDPPLWRLGWGLAALAAVACVVLLGAGWWLARRRASRSVRHDVPGL